MKACTIDGYSPVFEETERRALVHENAVANAAHVWCEFDDGNMEEVPIGAVRYGDSGEVFAGFAWDGDGLDPREYVVGTFEPCDVEDRLEPNVVAYLKDNGLMDIVVLSTVSMMRDWYDEVYGDAASVFLREALKRHVGEEKLEELES